MRVFIGFCVAALGLLTACQSVDPKPSVLPQDAQIQVYFNHLLAKGANYKDPYRNIQRPGDNLEEVLVAGINSAQQTIDVAVQEINLPLIAAALARKQQSGIEVRVIVENSYRRPWTEVSDSELGEFDEREQGKYQEFVALADEDKNGFLSPEETAKHDAIAILENAGVPLLDDTADGSKGSGLMHHKFMVVDGETVFSGSVNWTLSGIHGDFANLTTLGNVNHLLKIGDRRLASFFTEEFNEMWGDGVGGLPDSRFGVQKSQESPETFNVGASRVTVQFSPFSQATPWEATSNGLIGQALAQAQQSVQLALFVFSEQRLADILQSRAGAGVEVQALIDPSFAFREYSDALDLLGVNLKQKCDPFNRPWESPIQSVGTPRLAMGDKLHHKFGIVDGHTIITGSHNWSASANWQNDETVLIIHNPAIAQHFQREFERLYQDAYLGLPGYIAAKARPLPPNCTLAEPNGLVNINTASAAELETLPGIGESLAQRIIENRPYTSLVDLQRVSGIGEKTTADLKGKVTW